MIMILLMTVFKIVQVNGVVLLNMMNVEYVMVTGFQLAIVIVMVM